MTGQNDAAAVLNAPPHLSPAAPEQPEQSEKKPRAAKGEKTEKAGKGKKAEWVGQTVVAGKLRRYQFLKERPGSVFLLGGSPSRSTCSSSF